ncbi:MAG: hypothetical protein C4B58_04795 [Deltaproteobacteria bacterium]|nr:MAG: hypothetical protein C4B58_04795 [Deltaproteobacteria bacterium]
MTYLFSCDTLEWKCIGCAIKRYLDHCHDIEIEIVNAGDNTHAEPSVLILPLFENVKNKIKPSGLKTVSNRRQKQERQLNFVPIFLVLDEYSIPQHFNPELDMLSHAEEIIRNPNFMDVYKAVYLAELRYNEKTKRILNVINLARENALEKLAKILKESPQFPYLLIKQYHRTFVKYYQPFREITEPGYSDNIMCKFLGNLHSQSQQDCQKKLNESIAELNESIEYNDIKTEAFLKLSNRIYNCLNNIEEKDQGGHTVRLELFRAPVPFPLQELIDAKKEIEKNQLTADKRIKLLLIDNKMDKVKKKENSHDEGELISVLFDSEYCSMFELRMLGDLVWKKRGSIKTLNDDNYEILKKKETFDSKTFKDELKDYSVAKDKKAKEFAYLSKVYKKIKSAHFVLLDFFLNKQDTYLAFDFIRDVAEIKKREQDHSTTWYFITSAVYDSVVKYSQSGLLAEYYESAVVNAGDDPTNSKRQIIFIYKLLTFINARLKSFGSYKDLIFKRMLSEVKNAEGRPECCVKAKNERGVKREDPACQGKCEKDKCLKEMQTAIKRYLTEYDNIYSLFYDEDEKDKYKSAVVLLDDTITKFLLLPEADWQIIQHQIDYINAKLRKAKGKRQFSCSYINKEIERRSEIY